MPKYTETVEHGTIYENVLYTEIYVLTEGHKRRNSNTLTEKARVYREDEVVTTTEQNHVYCQRNENLPEINTTSSELINTSRKSEITSGETNITKYDKNCLIGCAEKQLTSPTDQCQVAEPSRVEREQSVVVLKTSRSHQSNNKENAKTDNTGIQQESTKTDNTGIQQESAKTDNTGIQQESAKTDNTGIQQETAKTDNRNTGIQKVKFHLHPLFAQYFILVFYNFFAVAVSSFACLT